MSSLTGARDDLAKALSLASRFTASHKSSPELNHLRLRRAEGGEVMVEATDQRASIRIALYATGPEEMDVLVHPDLANAVKAMSQGEVTITVDGTMVNVSGKGKATYSVATLDKEPVNAFPGEDELEWDDVVPIDASEALDVMDVAAKYASRKEENPSIIGVNLRVADGELAVEATDGARLFHDRVTLPSPGFPFSEDQVMLPPRMVTDLNRVFPDGEVAFAAGANLFFARDPNGETLFAARRIGGKFPDVSRIVPEHQKVLKVPRQDLADALGRISGVIKSKPVQLEFDDKELVIRAKTGTGSATEYVNLAEEAEHTEVAFNLEYLIDAVDLFEGDELVMYIKTPLLPVKLSATGERFFLMAPVKYN